MAVALHDSPEGPKILNGLKNYVNDNKAHLDVDLHRILSDKSVKVSFFSLVYHVD